MADEDTIVTDVMATPEQVLAAGGVSKRRRGASRRSPSGQRRRAPTPEPPKDLPLDPDEELEINSEESPTKPTTIKRISSTEKATVTKRSHSTPGEGRQSLTSSTTQTEVKREPAVKSDQGVQVIQKVELSPTKNVVVKRKSTTEKTLVTKRSQSSPGEGRQALPLSATTGDIKQETETEPAPAPRKRRLSDEAAKRLAVILSKTTTTTTAVPMKEGLQQDVEISNIKPHKERTPTETEEKTETIQVNKPGETVPNKVVEENVLEIKIAPTKDKSPTPKQKIQTTSPKDKSPTPKQEIQTTPPKDKSPTPQQEIQTTSPKDKSPTPNKVEEKFFSSPEPVTSVLSEKDEEVNEKTEEESPPVSGETEKDKHIKEAVWGPFFREVWQEWKKFVSEHSEQWGKIISQRNRCIGALFVMIIYCGIGGLIFRFTEGAFEAFYKCGVKRVKRDFVDSLWLGSHNLLEEEWKSQARKKLMDLESQLHAAHEAGVTTYSGQRAWSFLNAVVYCLTVVTTIGYGHISPSTTTGRAITIVYAIFGIPMFLILLADFGKLFTRGIKFMWAFVRRVYYTGSCRKVRRTVPVQEVMKGVQLVYDYATFRRPSQMMGEMGEDIRKAPIAHPEDIELQVPLNPQQQQTQQPPPNIPSSLPLDGFEPPAPGTPAPTFEVDDEFNLPISVAIVILLIYIFVGATIYWTWENWGFFESFYFVFISMSTIGFGDFVPQHPMYMMASIVYLVFGLALTSMCINVVQEKLSDSFRQASAKIGATIGLRVNEEDGTITPIPPVQIELPEVHNTITKSQST